MAAMAAALMLPSCSSEDVIAPEAIENQPATENVASEVEISLKAGTSSIETRAAVTSTTTLPEDLGIWCLAKDLQGINQAAQPIRWFSSDPDAVTCCLMKNVRASLTDGQVNWSGSYFYPISQFYRYEFFANYPYTADMQTTSTTVTANYTLDGRTDLIWGNATSSEEYAWSAKYFRKNGGVTDSNTPSVTLEHLLARLTFTIEPGAKIEGVVPLDYTDAAKMKVVSIQVCDVYKNVQVKIADSENPSMPVANRLTLRDAVTDTLSLCNELGVPFSKVQVPATPAGKIQVGESIMLVPAITYKVRVVVEDEAGKKFVSESPLTLTDMAFERGNSYTVRVVVHSPTEISLKASITPWNVIEGPTLDL